MSSQGAVYKLSACLTYHPRRLTERNGGVLLSPQSLSLQPAQASETSCWLQRMAFKSWGRLTIQVWVTFWGVPPRKKKFHLKIFSNVFFLHLFNVSRAATPAWVRSGQRPQDRGKSSRSLLADPKGTGHPVRPLHITRLSTGFRSNLKWMRSINRYVAL